MQPESESSRCCNIQPNSVLLSRSSRQEGVARSQHAQCQTSLATQNRIWGPSKQVKTAGSFWLWNQGSPEVDVLPWWHGLVTLCSAVEPTTKDWPIGHKNVVSQDRGLVIVLTCGSSTTNMWYFNQNWWSLTAKVSQDRFHCSQSHRRPLSRTLASGSCGYYHHFWPFQPVLVAVNSWYLMLSMLSGHFKQYTGGRKQESRQTIGV